MSGGGHTWGKTDKPVGEGVNWEKGDKLGTGNALAIKGGRRDKARLAERALDDLGAGREKCEWKGTNT